MVLNFKKMNKYYVFISIFFLFFILFRLNVNLVGEELHWITRVLFVQIVQNERKKPRHVERGRLQQRRHNVANEPIETRNGHKSYHGNANNCCAAYCSMRHAAQARHFAVHKCLRGAFNDYAREADANRRRPLIAVHVPEINKEEAKECGAERNKKIYKLSFF